MKKLLKNKVLLISIFAISVIVVFIAGAVFFSFSGKQGNDMAAIPTQVPIPSISAKEIGLTLENGVPGKTVIIKVANTKGLTAIEYDLTYTAKNTTTAQDEGNTSERLLRGLNGLFDDIKGTVSKEVKLGTCSDVCHYDTEVKDIKIVLKVTKEDGKVYQSEATLASTGE